MIIKLFKEPHVLYQETSEDLGISEPAISVSVSNDPLIVLSQEGREIIVNPESVNELTKLMKKLAKSLETPSSQ